MADQGVMISGHGDHYEVQWYYGVNGVWFDGGSSSVKMNNATYSVPSNATKLKVTVKPVAKTYKSGDQDVPYWSSEEVTVEMNVSELPPAQLSAPSVSIEKYNLTAKIENITDAKASYVEFEVVKGNRVFKTGRVEVKTARAIYICPIEAGGEYRARCRAINVIGGKDIVGEWSQYSSEVGAIPAAPTNVKISIESTKSVRVTWDQCTTATSYKVEYATNKLYFDASSEVKSATSETNYCIITGIEQGHEYYFRVQAVNSKGSSSWSDIIYKIVGTKPEPPTTWSLTASAIIGDPMTLYWTHNSQDASKQYEAQIELTINGKANIVTLDTSKEEIKDNETKIYTYDLDLSKYTEGAEILWRVRSRGVSLEYSDWSVQRKINTYAPPVVTLTLNEGNTALTSYPYRIKVEAGPSTQEAININISIVANNSYRTQDSTGKNVIVNAGEVIFSKNSPATKNTLTHVLMPQDCILENNQSYKVNVTASMNSGLTASTSADFVVSWEEISFYPDARITINKDSVCAYINPFCYDENYEIHDNVVLAVYRREFNGEFTEIATEIPNYGSVSVTDPHPAMDYARYRIVARNKNTNVIGFTDIPPIKVNEPGIIIQWDEEWTSFGSLAETAPEIPFYNGSMVRLPYNTDTSESSDVDTELVEYIGRKSPVAYFGTQQGITGSWTCEIPRSDKDTIYALRRLQIWMGTVYVREQNGTGYNAFINVTFTNKHDSLVIPVTLTVKRVEGGI